MNDFKDDIEDATLEQVNNVRKVLKIVNQECGDDMLNYYGGNLDHEFLVTPVEMYPGMTLVSHNNLYRSKRFDC